MSVQALQAALRTAPVLLVLDNVSEDTARAALPFLVARHAGSLLVATAWHKKSFSALSQAQIRQGETEPACFHLLAMAGALVLQPRHAVQLVQEQMQLSRRAEGLPPLAAHQLTDLAERAAAALAFNTAPMYVPCLSAHAPWAALQSSLMHFTHFSVS